MQLAGERLLFSPSDLGAFAGCEHLTQLEVLVALGERERPAGEDPFGEIRRRKGDEHEAAYLATLREAGHTVVEVGLGEDRDWEAAAARTAEAMQAGAAYVYQAVLLHDGWRGIADFLERVERPSALGPFSYEVLDTKLARRPRPDHALQLCFYTEAVAALQQATPLQAAVVLGTRERYVLRIADVEAYYRRLRARFLEAVTARPRTEPVRCDHCQYCDFRAVCEAEWEARDHLNRVAGIRRDQIERLGVAGIETLTALARAAPGTTVRRLQPETFEGLREQAALQLETRERGEVAWRLRPLEDGRGFAVLPAASPGDLILDFEGHPFFEPARGLEFLFGTLRREGDAWCYEATWAHDRDAERRAFERLVDLVHARLAAYPDMHLYHYGSYEGSALKRLMGEHGTREHELDELLRRRVLCDLYSLLRQALRAGLPSYSLKEVERLAGFVRGAGVGSGADAVVSYERWLETGDSALLEEILAYNEEDCRATLALLDWLRARRPPGLAWPEPLEGKELPEEKREELDERARLREALTAGEEPGSPRWLAGELLEYHRREARPAWWAWFGRLAMSPAELVDDPESIGGLEAAGEPEPSARSFLWTLRFPEQDHKLSPGDEVTDPATGAAAGDLLEIDDASRTLRLRRGPKLAGTPLPAALVGGKPYGDEGQRGALLRLARSVATADGRYPALEAILAREPPRLAGRKPGEPVQTTALGELRALALGLEESYLFVQGPPGTGKTWRGARLVCHLLAHGRRVGVTAQSHKVIHNLLRAVEDAAAEQGLAFAGVKKCTGGNPESVYEGSGLIENEASARALADRRADLVAGTAWLFSRPELERQLDVLVVDEAGQFSLADTLACGTAARSLILLGDPLQLAQVSQGAHPPGTGASVLEHLLGTEPTVPPDRGVFLDRSFRMHPDVCEFVSQLVYAGRLGSDEGAAARSTAFGTGIRYLPVVHEGNGSSSQEEVERVALEIGQMAGGGFVEADGSVRALQHEDFMVVTPYNAQVNRLRAALPAGVQVGTVDKLQGREAPVVFFSMATSSGDDVPRNLAFLFSRNRLNVAVSRAQCLAVLVCSPRLLEARCRSIEEMQLVNALCRLVEVAEAQAA